MNFKFHHTKGNIIVMVKTLSGPNNVPKYAFTNIGVGWCYYYLKNFYIFFYYYLSINQ